MRAALASLTLVLAACGDIDVRVAETPPPEPEAPALPPACDDQPAGEDSIVKVAHEHVIVVSLREQLGDHAPDLSGAEQQNTMHDPGSRCDELSRDPTSSASLVDYPSLSRSAGN